MITDAIIGRSASMQKIRTLIQKVAPTDSTILITGETGTGKDLVARTVHGLSPRAEQPFVTINCGAMPESLIESELFGHRRGAFTGATEHTKGLFEAANLGTFFLDEIGEMTQALQVKLLRVLEHGEIRAVGDTESRHVNVRVLAATNKDLWKEAEAGRFRSDLYFRLNVLHMYLPPLRERRDDIPLLIRHFLELYTHQYEKAIVGFTDEALSILMNYPYPGNVRELQNIMQHAVIFSSDNTLSPSDLPPHVSTSPKRLHGQEPTALNGAEEEEGLSLELMEQKLIEKALRLCQGNHTETARRLGISRSTLWRKLKQYHIPSPPLPISTHPST